MPASDRCHHCDQRAADGASRCPQCRKHRGRKDQRRRRYRARLRFLPERRAELLRRVGGGEHLTEVCIDLGLSHQQVYGYAATHPHWGSLLDGALMAGRDPGLDHGTPAAYRWGRCRCPDCRQAKHPLGQRGVDVRTAFRVVSSSTE